MRKVIYCLLIWCCVFSAKAQSFEANVGLGLLFYNGDINSSEPKNTLLDQSGLAISLGLRHHFNDRISMKGGLLYGKVKADDKDSPKEWQRIRNLSFKSSILELSLLGEYKLLKFDRSRGDRFGLYLTAGLSSFYFNPTTQFEGKTVALQPLGTEGQGMPGFAKKYSRISFAIPVGGGLLFRLSDGLYLDCSLILRKTFTDYLDDVSTNYVTYSDLVNGNGITAAKLSDRTPEYYNSAEPSTRMTGDTRGNSNIDDYYISALITLCFDIDMPGFGGNGRRKTRYDGSCPKF